MSEIKESSVRTICPLPTRYGNANLISFANLDQKEHVAISFGSEVSVDSIVNVRIHSECVTSEIFGSLKCDCAEQLDEALSLAAATNGIVLYLKQEGRGIGLYNKIDAYKLQAEGLNTIEANRALDLPDDLRDFSIAAKMLNALNIKKVNLLTNNPEKIKGLTDNGIQVMKRIPTGVFMSKQNEDYLKTKVESCGHLIDVGKNKYVGVSGIKNLNDITAAFNASMLFRSELESEKRYINLGISVNYLELADEKRKIEINQIVSRYLGDSNIKTTVHLSLKDVEKEETILNNINSFFPFVDSVQINDYKDINNIVNNMGTRKLIIPIYDENDNSILLNNSSVEIINQSGSFLILDNSKGRGISANIDNLESNVRFYSGLGYQNIAIAGGFGPNSLEAYDRLKNLGVSVDAETKLLSDGKIDRAKVFSYLEECLSFEDIDFEDQVG